MANTVNFSGSADRDQNFATLLDFSLGRITDLTALERLGLAGAKTCSCSWPKRACPCHA